MSVPLVDLKAAGGSSPVVLAGLEQAPVIPFREPLVMPKTMRMRDPDRLSIYRNENGEGVFAVARWDARGPLGKKAIRPFIWNGREHVCSGARGPRPLLHLPEIVAHEMAPILVVEGEKTAETAGRYLPEGWVITTWCGGAAAIHHTDWAPIRGRRVVIWPDNDEPGMAAALAVRDNVPGSAIVNVPKFWPEGWDLADELPASATRTDIVMMLQSAMNETSEIESILPTEEPADMLQDDSDITFRALGDDDDHIYAMPAGRGIIVKMKHKEAMTAAGCLRLVNNIDYWQQTFPSRGGGGVDWTAAGSYIMMLCEKAGRFDEARLCGRGVWYEKGSNSVVVNTGDMLIVNGQHVNPAGYQSRNIYRTSEALFEEFDPNDRLSDGEGRLIVELCNTPRWEKSIYGDLLAGYIATSIICGGLKWRTHVWVTGNSGSGKSTVVNNIAAACIGDMALYPLGETTESGIRQMIGQDARPIIFDEMEGTDQSRSQQGDARRQAIIQLMRMSSTTSKGRIMKGSAGHKAVSFTMRSSFLVASIGVNLKEAPDLTRTMVLALKPLSRDASNAEREEAEERWAQMNRLSARIGEDLPARLFARQAKLLPVIRKNAETFCEVIADLMGNRRIGDQVGTLLAGRCSLTSSAVMTYDECKEYVLRFDWSGAVAAPSEREDKMLIRHLRQTITKVMGDDGRMHERSIGELVMQCLGYTLDPEVSNSKANNHLRRLGLLASKERGVWIGKGIDELNKVMRSSPNASDWWSVISRYPGSEAKLNVEFAGIKSFAILIPEEEWL
jgi:putative DNA primase/helicase